MCALHLTGGAGAYLSVCDGCIDLFVYIEVLERCTAHLYGALIDGAGAYINACDDCIAQFAYIKVPKRFTADSYGAVHT